MRACALRFVFCSSVPRRVHVSEQLHGLALGDGRRRRLAGLCFFPYPGGTGGSPCRDDVGLIIPQARSKVTCSTNQQPLGDVRDPYNRESSKHPAAAQTRHPNRASLEPFEEDELPELPDSIKLSTSVRRILQLGQPGLMHKPMAS